MRSEFEDDVVEQPTPQVQTHPKTLNTPTHDLMIPLEKQPILDAADINQARIESLKAAIASGHYSSNNTLIAEKMMDVESSS